MGVFQKLKHEKDQISSKSRLRRQLEIHTLSVRQPVCKWVEVNDTALYKYLPMQQTMSKEAGLSHSLNTPQTVFLFSLPKPDINLKRFHNMLPFRKWISIL